MTSGSIKVAGLSDFLHLNKPRYSVFSITTERSNMQFKIVSALIFATLAAAGALPRADANIDPPVPGKTTISPSECTSGHLRCCKFSFSYDRYSTTMKTDYTIIGQSAQSPTSPAVTPLLHPYGISASSISGLVGITCQALPDDAKLQDWFVSGRSMNDLKFNFLFFFASPNAPVCCTDNTHGKRSAIKIFFCPSKYSSLFSRC